VSTDLRRLTSIILNREAPRAAAEVRKLDRKLCPEKLFPNYQGKGLQLEFMVEDEGVFTMPWSASITYRRPRRNEWLEIVCAENTREYYAKGDTGVPHADKPDF
jgi:hypothetical protein